MTATTTTPTETFTWDRLTLAVTVGYCLLVAGLSTGVVLGELRNQFHLSGVVAALHGSTFGVALLVVGIWGVSIVDRLGRGNALRLSGAALVAGVLLFGVGPLWQLTLTGTALSGFGGAMFVMVVPGVISDHHGDHRAAAFAAVNGVPGAIGVAFSLAIGAALGLRWSWRGPYLVLTAVIAACLFLVARPVSLPTSARHGRFSLAHFRRREVLVPWLFIVNAVLTEFTVGIWAATYLKEAGGASSGLAPALAGAFGITMFLSRMVLPTTLRRLRGATISVSFLTIGAGAIVMCFGPGLTLKVLGLVIVGFGGGPLYPLTVDRLYERAGSTVDSVSLGAIGAMASGAAVTVGPLALGVLADSVGLRRAILIVPALALLGAVTQRPRRGELAVPSLLG